MGYAQISNRVRWLWEETNFEDYVLSYIHLCEIKVEVYVTFIYEESMYTRYIYYVYVEVYVNLQVEVIKVLNFPLNSTYECDDVR